MWKTSGVLLAVLAVGCGSDGADKCEVSDRTGSYRGHYVEISGDCGPLPDDVVTLTNGSGVLESTCAFDFRRWSNNNCQFESSSTCTSAADDMHITTQGVTTETEGGDKIAGIVTVSAAKVSDGSYVCRSTYQATATRQ